MLSQTMQFATSTTANNFFIQPKAMQIDQQKPKSSLQHRHVDDV